MTKASSTLRSQLCLTLLGLSLHGGIANAGVLADIYRQALATDPQLQSAEASYQATREIEAQNRSTLLPQIGLSASTSYRDTDPAAITGGNSHSYGVTLTQPLFRAANWFNFKQGQLRSEQAQVRFSRAQQDLILRTTTSYLDVLQARTNLASAQSEEKAVKRRLDQVSAQFEVGLIAVTDVQEAQAAYDNTRVTRILAEGQLDNSYEALERLTGQPYTAVALLAADYPIQALVPDSRQPWVDKATEQNLELLISRFDVDAALETTRASSAGHYPTLDFTASYSDDESGSFDGSNSAIGLTLNVPLYSGGFTRSKERESQALLTVAKQNQQNIYRKVVQDTRSLFRNLRTDRATIQARQQSIRSSESALEATAAGFEVGTRNVVDVLQAERQLFAAQRDYATARYDYVRNLFQFKQAIGTLNPDDLFELDGWMK